MADRRKKRPGRAHKRRLARLAAVGVHPMPIDGGHRCDHCERLTRWNTPHGLFCTEHMREILSHG